MSKRVLFAYGLGLAGVALTVGLTLGAFALAGSGLSQPAAPLAPTFRPSHTPFQTDSPGGDDRNQPDDDPTRSPGRDGEGDDHGGSGSGASGGGGDDRGSNSSGSDDSGSSEGSGSDGGSGSDDNSGSGSGDDGGSDDHSGSGGGSDSGSGSDDSGDD